MIGISTGNKIDVIYDFEGQKKVILGLRQHGSDKIIHLPYPEGLAQVLNTVIIEVKEYNSKAT